jgi:hypothetical protein
LTQKFVPNGEVTPGPVYGTIGAMDFSGLPSADKAEALPWRDRPTRLPEWGARIGAPALGVPAVLMQVRLLEGEDFTGSFDFVGYLSAIFVAGAAGAVVGGFVGLLLGCLLVRRQGAGLPFVHIAAIIGGAGIVTAVALAALCVPAIFFGTATVTGLVAIAVPFLCIPMGARLAYSATARVIPKRVDAAWAPEGSLDA